MANPQTEKGHVQLANDIFEALYVFDFNKRELRVLLAVIRNTYGWRRKTAKISASSIATSLGMARQNVTSTLQALVKANVLLCTKPPEANAPGVYGLQKNWETWTLKLLGETPQARRSNTRAHQKNDAGVHQKNDAGVHQNFDAGGCIKKMMQGVHQKNDAGVSQNSDSALHQNDIFFDAPPPPSNTDGKGIVGVPKDKERHERHDLKTERPQNCDDFFRENAHLFDGSEPTDLFSAAVKLLTQVVPGWEPGMAEERQIRTILKTDCPDSLKLEAFSRVLDTGRDTRGWAMGKGMSLSFIASNMLKSVPAILGCLIDERSGKKTTRTKPQEYTPPYHLHCFNPDAKPPQRKENPNEQ